MSMFLGRADRFDAGAGGGFDVSPGCPSHSRSSGAGASVFLANLTFADLRYERTRPLHEAIVGVDADSGGSEAYFPEKFPCRWFRSQGEERRVHCLEKTGVGPLTEAYRILANHLQVDAIVLVDGGVLEAFRSRRSVNPWRTIPARSSPAAERSGAARRLRPKVPEESMTPRP